MLYSHEFAFFSCALSSPFQCTYNFQFCHVYSFLKSKFAFYGVYPCFFFLSFIYFFNFLHPISFRLHLLVGAIVFLKEKEECHPRTRLDSLSILVYESVQFTKPCCVHVCGCGSNGFMFLGLPIVRVVPLQMGYRMKYAVLCNGISLLERSPSPFYTLVHELKFTYQSLTFV